MIYGLERSFDAVGVHDNVPVTDPEDGVVVKDGGLADLNASPLEAIFTALPSGSLATTVKLNGVPGATT